ncbi:MAG: P-type conjugative transfer protein TrbG [Phenylobacterium sp.]|uniref:P-type conjugative transfer protein TrbG n=1 Tax=Phenylobacterium sp. TaxID=1871053 RepID=UPI002736EB62|nr:P-type conjugative transfer protein TrbG [Phenylobacterium sp.]MDP3746669.1 P-type conjugative transfer protein TrbG [Phenylobacterium sp.]
MNRKLLPALASLLALVPAGVGAAPPAAHPVPAAVESAAQVWPYAAGTVYPVQASPGRVTDIALQPGEKLVSVSAGDTARWIIGDTSSGSGADARAHVLVKPTASGLATNLLLHTDRRTYHLELTARPTGWMAAAGWRYPEGELIAVKAAEAQAQAAAPVADGVALERLNFGYVLRGDKPAWRPVLAFDDGARTYIRFPDAPDELPPLFVLGPKGEAQLVNYRARPPYYVVDGLFAAAELRLGTGKQVRVRIERSGRAGRGRR